MSVNNLRLKVSVCGILAAAAISGVAAAEDKVSMLEEIVVTAQKRQETLQEVPIAISAFTSEARDKLGIITLQDFTDFTPGITYSTSLDRMSVRGIGRQTNNLATSSSVATYGDGFYNSSNHQADTSTMFTERVEVLRGPQGTLYGRNSIGGALNVLLKRPKNEWGGEARAIAGNYGRKEIEGTFTGPLTDWLRFRIGAGLYQQDSGFVDNIVPGKDDGYGQRNDKFLLLMLDGNVGDKVDWFFKFTHSEWDQGYGTSVNLSDYSTTRACTAACFRASLIAAGSLGPSALYNTGFNLNPASPQYTTVNPGTYDHRAVNWDTPSHNTLIPDNILVLEAVGHLGFADLKYVGGYHEYEYILNSDFDNSDRFSFTYTGPAATAPGCTVTTCNNTPFTIYSQVISTYIERKRYYSNELNLISTNDGPFQWVGGLYNYREYYEQPVDTFNPNQTQLRTPLLGPTYATAAAPNPHGTYQFTDAHTTTVSSAVFGQVDWKIVNSLKMTLGARYTKDKKTGTEYMRRMYWDPTNLGPFASALDLTPGTFNTPTIGAYAVNDGTGNWARDYDNEWHAATGTAGFAWSPLEGSNGYAKFTRGYKDGGVNAGSMVALTLLYTDPEYVNAYEIGWKQELGGQLTANLSVFYYDYQGAQYPLTLINPPPAVGTSSQIFNIDSISRGLELETVWKPISELQLALNYAYLNTHMKDRNCYSKSTYISGVDDKACGPSSASGGPVYILGNEVPGSPNHKVSFNAMYTFGFDPGSLTFSGSYVWRSSQYSSILGGDEYKVPGYSKVDLRAIWTGKNNDYSVLAYLRNALNKEGFDGVGAAVGSSGITQSYSLTPPRQFGLELQYRFGSAK